jgi:ADP-ribosyl-[dinitrogen reductase] hydrolase
MALNIHDSAYMSKLSHPQSQSATGALVGAAVGDALGAPFEFKPANTYAQTFPDKVLGGVGEMIGGGAFHWAPGEFTDDTQMALALAESLIACGLSF